jgi:hypothetical protein
MLNLYTKGSSLVCFFPPPPPPPPPPLSVENLRSARRRARASPQGDPQRKPPCPARSLPPSLPPSLPSGSLGEGIEQTALHEPSIGHKSGSCLHERVC